MSVENKKVKVFAGNSNKNLVDLILKNLNLPIGRATVSTFSDGEISVSIQESVRGSDCFVIQSTSFPVNTNLMELLILIDALKRASAGRITAVLPYFGYARQDRKSKARDPISAKLCADLLVAAGANRILTMDLHAPQIQGFFNIPVDNLLGVEVLASSLKKSSCLNVKSDDFLVVSPDLGSVTRARNLARKLNVALAIVDKRRPKANCCEVMNIIGSVEGKDVLIVDDMIDTAGTLCGAANAIIEVGGAKSVSACATHGVLSGPAIERIENSRIEKLMITDTIALPKTKYISKILVVSVAEIFASAIENIHYDKAVSPLFGEGEV